MTPDELCTSDTWSPLTAASTHSQLAGVLGGFLITAIALLFDRNSREAVHILALFSDCEHQPIRQRGGLYRRP